MGTINSDRSYCTIIRLEAYDLSQPYARVSCPLSQFKGETGRQ